MPLTPCRSFILSACAVKTPLKEARALINSYHKCVTRQDDQQNQADIVFSLLVVGDLHDGHCAQDQQIDGFCEVNTRANVRLTVTMKGQDYDAQENHQYLGMKEKEQIILLKHVQYNGILNS